MIKWARMYDHSSSAAADATVPLAHDAAADPNRSTASTSSTSLILPGPQHGPAAPPRRSIQRSSAPTEQQHSRPPSKPLKFALPALDSPTSAVSTASDTLFGDMSATGGFTSAWGSSAARPQTSPMQTARSGGAEAPPPSMARASMPELAAALRRSASVPHPAGPKAGGKCGSGVISKGREAQAESILELWDLKRAMEQTAKRDKVPF